MPTLGWYNSTAFTIRHTSNRRLLLFGVWSNLGSNLTGSQYGLYDYQRQVMLDTIARIDEPRRLADPYPRVLLHLPTGAGKTRIATHLACELLNRSRDDSIVIWLASGTELLDQAAGELERGWDHLGRSEIYVHRLWGNESVNWDNLGGGFLVAGLSKLRWAEAGDTGLLNRLSHRVRAAIFDEAHQAPASTYEYVAEQLAGHGAVLIGLTATPGRGWGLSDEDERLADLFQANRVEIDSRGHPNPVAYLVANGYLASPRFRAVDFDSGGFEVSKSVDYGTEVLERLGDDDDRNARIVDLVTAELRRCGRMIVFCPSVRSAGQCHEMMEGRGLRSGLVTATTPSEQRARVISEYRDSSGGAMALFNFGVLTAGFDAPATRGVVIARPTQSVVLYSQMAGRALRGPRSGGNRSAWIYTVVDTGLPGFRSVADAFGNWEELWSRTANS